MVYFLFAIENSCICE